MCLPPARLLPTRVSNLRANRHTNSCHTEWSMKSACAGVVFAAILVLCCFMMVRGSLTQPAASIHASYSRLAIDYPLEGSLFPPEIMAPTFLWHDDNQ